MGLVTIVTRLGSLSQENLRNCTILGLMLMTKPAKAALNAFRSEDYQRAMELAMPHKEIIKTIVALAQGLKLSTIAEGWKLKFRGNSWKSRTVALGKDSSGGVHYRHRLLVLRLPQNKVI